MGTGYNLHVGFCVILCVGLWWKKRTSVWRKIFSLTKTIAANQEKKEDDTSLILCTAVNSDESLEEKNDWAQEVTYMVRKGGREEERKLRAGPGFYLWFVYLCTSQWFPAPNLSWRLTLNERDVPNRRKCFRPFTWCSEPYWASRQTFVSSLYSFSMNLLTYLHRPH